MIDIIRSSWKNLLLISFVISILGFTYNYPNSKIELGKKVYAADSKSHKVKISKKSDSKSTGETKIDPRTDSLLKEMAYYIGSKNNYTFKAEIMYDDILDSGRKLQISASEKVFLEKPNKVFIEYNSDNSATKLLYNDNNLTLLDLTTNLYSKIIAPGTNDKTFDQLLNVYGYAPPLSDLFYLFPYRKMIENVEASSYIGSSVVFGVRCHHLAFEEKNKDWQIWLEDGKRRIPRKIVITYKKVPGSPQFIAIVKDWILNEPFSKLLFKSDLIKNARESETNMLINKSGNNLGIIRSPGS